MTGQPLICPLCSGQKTGFFFQDTKNFQHCYHSCTACDLVFVLPEQRLNAADEKVRYDMHENDESEPYVQFLSRLAKPLLEHLDKSSNGLDFGSGRSEAMAKIFRHQGHNCVCYDIYYYPDEILLQQQYDFIVASEVIEHLYNPKMVVEQWLKMLKPNGLLGIMTGIRPADDKFANWWYKNDPTHVSLFSQLTFDYLAANYQLLPRFQSGNVTVFQKIKS